MKSPIRRLRALLAEVVHLPEQALHRARRAGAVRLVQEAAPVRSVLVVCHGNICRSPYAAAVLRRELGAGPVTVTSGGFFGPGRPAPTEALAAAEARGIDLAAHRSALVSTDAIADADIVVVMDRRQRDALIRSFGARPRRTVLLGDFDPQPISRRAIRDPVEQPAEVFEAVYQRIDRCVRRLAGLVVGAPLVPQRPVAARGVRRRAPRRVLLVEINEDGTVGGSHRCLFDLVRKLDRHRYTPVVLFYESNPYVERLRALGIEVHGWDAKRRFERDGRPRGGVVPRLYSRGRAGAAIFRRARFLRSQRIDLVHLNNSPCVGFSDWLPAARLLGTPCVAHARGAYVRPGSGLGRWLTRRYDRVIAISRHIAEDMTAAGIPPGRVRQIYDGIDLEEWDGSGRTEPERIRGSLGIAPSAVLIVMVSHLRWWKGQDVLLSALREMEPADRCRLHALIVGGSPESDAAYQERLLRSVAEAGLEDRVTFLGDRDDVPDLIHASDIVVHASTIPEPFGLVVLEGMAAGRAVVASRLGGPAEIVTPESGVLFDPARPAELAAVLGSLVDDPVHRRALGEGGRERVRAFDIHHNVAAIKRVYGELLRGGT
jgi:glycosyltransferase involved in cell wall biosynthesis/protein-tyrosine-phosphatase